MSVDNKRHICWTADLGQFNVIWPKQQMAGKYRQLGFSNYGIMINSNQTIYFDQQFQLIKEIDSKPLKFWF